MIAAALSAIGNCVRAHDDAAAKHASKPAFTAAEQFAPTPLPDRVVLTWSGDPRGSIDVTWRTDLTANATQAEFLPAAEIIGDHHEGHIDNCRKTSGAHAEFKSDLETCLMHSVTLKPLQPGTMYAYRVGDGDHWSEWFQFRTAFASPKPFTFVYFGDAQNSIRSLWSRVIREASQHAPRSAFMLHAGDLVNDADNDAQWGEWFGAGGWLNGMIPTIATPGNHEYNGGDGVAKHWGPQFSFPANGPAGLEETVYWLDYQGARIISLNSNERTEQQCEWLEQVLRDPRRPKWTIVTFHHPIYSAAKDRDNPELRKLWQPIFDEQGVDLVLQGHDHAYARSGLGGPRNVAEGVRRHDSRTVYVVSVSGPKQYPLQEAWDVSRVASGAQLFQIIHVAPEKIDYEARLASGELYDAFTLKKDDAGRSELTERVPPTPEIRAE